MNFAVMSPDDRWVIAFIWPVGGGLSLEPPAAPLPIVRIPIAGGAQETILQLSRPAPVSCARPPSNTCVIAEQTDDQKQMIFVDNLICAISPDGTRLAIARSLESPIEIHSLRGQLIHVIPSGISGKKIAIGWAADREGFFVTRQAPGGTELLHLDLNGRAESLRKCSVELVLPRPLPTAVIWQFLTIGRA